MNCARCGNEIPDGQLVMAVYGDPAFAEKKQDAFPLDADCFNGNEIITAQEWQPIEGDPVNGHELVDITITRYVRVS